MRTTRLNTRATMADVAALKSPGNGVVTVNEAPTTPLRYGAVGDGFTLDDAAFAAMTAALPSAGAHVYIPSGYNFFLSSPIVLSGNPHWSGGGANARITNHSSDVFTSSGYMAWMHMHDFRVDSAGGGGHILNFQTYGVSKSQVDNMVFIQNVANRSVLQSGYWLDNFFRSSHLFGATNRSVPLINMIGTTDNLADNTWEDLTLTDATGASTWAIWIEEQAPSLAYANKFRGINFENPVGGALTLRGHINYLVESCEFWDLATPATNHLFYGAAGGGSGLPTRDGRIKKTVRCSGTLGSGISDIAFGPVGSEFNTVVSEIHGTSLVQVIDLQHNIGCRIEDCTNIAIGSSYAPIYTVKTAAGTGASAILDPNVSNLYSAGCQLTCGSASTTAGDLLDVTHNSNGWMAAVPAAVNITPRNLAAAQAGLYVTMNPPTGYSSLASGFTVAAANAPANGAILRFTYSIVRSVNGG